MSHGASGNAPPGPPNVLVGIECHLCDDEGHLPNNCAYDVNGGSRDLMKGHGGKYSYLGAKIERYSKDALTNITVDITGDSRGDSWTDLAKGCGGNYVYLVEHRDSNNPHKISEIAILRSGDEKNIGDIQSKGYSGMTGDVCKGRGGDYVYIIWKTVKVL